jgi:putative ABC transport system substrate-binding protein
MKRREFIYLVGVAAAAWPLAARGQQSEQMKRIGVLMFYADSDHEGQKRVTVFREELQRLGWEEGRNMQIEYHWYMGDVEKARASAAELVRIAPDVIVANGAAGLEKLQKATRTIPIVFTLIGEPVARGFVQSLARPGGNITGFTNLEATTAAKWIELLKEIAPSVKRVAIIYNPATSPFAILFARSAEVAAQTLELEPVSAVVHSPGEIEATIKTLSTDPGASLIVVPDGFAQTHRKLIIELAARYSLPAVYPFRFFPNDGGLLSYGVEPHGVFRQTAAYVDRILRGAKPADLPVQQPTKFELVINLKTAKTLGLTIPPTLLSRADALIE